MGWSHVLVPAVFIWAAVWCVPWRPWRADESLNAFHRACGRAGAGPRGLTVLIPARNEAQVIERTLRALQRQGVALQVVLIDDQSEDDTVARASALGLSHLVIVHGTAPPSGWTGKLWALEQGRSCVDTPLTLLLDADVELGPGILAALRTKMEREGLQLASLMVWLRMEGFWEWLLMPAFVYFFKLLYPFRLANRPSNPYVAAAAGGGACCSKRACSMSWAASGRSVAH